MTCVKTGAVIFVAPENTAYRCDAFELYGVMWFRIVEDSAEVAESQTFNFMIQDYAAWYDREQRYSTLICGPHDYVKGA